MKTHAASKPPTIWIAVALGALALTGGVYSFGQKSTPEGHSANNDLSAYAAEIIQICAGNSNRQPCYDDEIPKLMDRISMEDAFRVTELIQKKDGTYWYCHVLSHKLVAKEIQKDPSDWKRVITRCPEDMCSNGCLHGGFQERFKLENLDDQQFEAFLPELATVCESRPEWQPTEHIHTGCYHGMGHLLMYLTSADLHKATEACRKIAVQPSGNYVQTCTEGAFMQLYQPREAEDFALVKGKVPEPDQVIEFCKQFPGMAGEACRREGWSLATERIRTAAGIMDYCSYATEGSNEHYLCLDKMFRSAMTILNFDESAMKEICSGIPLKHQALCFGDIAARMITADKNLVERAVAVCDFAADRKQGDECYRQMAKYAGQIFHPSSSEAQNMCNALPDAWAKRCPSAR